MSPTDEALKMAQELSEISLMVSEPLPKDPEGLLTQADFRSAWLARVGEMEANAQAMLDRRRGEVSDEYSDLPATLYRDKVTGEVADFQRLVNFSHKLYATLTEQIELIRTMVSYAKHERGR